MHRGARLRSRRQSWGRAGARRELALGLLDIRPRLGAACVGERGPQGRGVDGVEELCRQGRPPSPSPVEDRMGARRERRASSASEASTTDAGRECEGGRRGIFNYLPP
jgi:hypothetical protein